MWSSPGKNFTNLASGSSVTDSITIDEDIILGLVFFHIAHCGASNITVPGAYWSVSMTQGTTYIKPNKGRNGTVVPVAKSWDNSLYSSFYAENISAGTYTLTFTNNTEIMTANYGSTVFATVIKLV